MTPICVMCGVDRGTGFLRHEWCVNDGYYNLMEREKERKDETYSHLYQREKVSQKESQGRNCIISLDYCANRVD